MKNNLLRQESGVAAETPRIALRTSGSNRLAATLARVWVDNRTAILETLILFLSIRVLLSLIAFIALGMLPEQSGLHSTFHRSNNIFLDVWARWDSEYYLDIAQFGYLMRPQLLVFFPFYPLLVSVVAPLVAQNYVLAGTIVSSVSCFAALFYMLKLGTFEFGPKVGYRAALYLAAFPMSFFMLAVYTESLFLACAVATFYYARRGFWAPAALAVFLAALTRPTGFVLAVPLLYEVWRQTDGNWRRLKPLHLLAAAAGPLGVAVFALYLGLITGDSLALLHARYQPPFWRESALPWNTIWSAITNLQRSDLSPLARVVNSVDLATTLLLIEAAVISWWALPRAYTIYIVTSVLLLLSLTIPDWPLQSMPRYAMAIFPIFILLARLGANRQWHQLILMISTLLLGMYMALFATWYWVF